MKASFCVYFFSAFRHFFTIYKFTIKVHLFLRCRNYNNIRVTLINEFNDIDNSITSRKLNELLRIFFYGDCEFNDNVNKDSINQK